MPTRYKLVLVFNSSGTTPLWGFSESFYTNSDVVGDPRGWAQQVVDARRQILASCVSIVAAKLYQNLAPKLSAKTGKWFLSGTFMNLCPDLNLGPGQAGSTDTPAAAVLIQLYATAGARASNRQMRGIPDAVWQNCKVATGRGQFISFWQTLQSLGERIITVKASTGALTDSPIGCIKFARISSRRVGRPFGQLRGRRSKRKSTPATP